MCARCILLLPSPRWFTNSSISGIFLFALSSAPFSEQDSVTRGTYIQNGRVGCYVFVKVSVYMGGNEREREYVMYGRREITIFWSRILSYAKAASSPRAFSSRRGPFGAIDISCIIDTYLQFPSTLHWDGTVRGMFLIFYRSCRLRDSRKM